MGRDQVAAIRPVIAELEADERALGARGRARYFARFSLASLGCPWVEVHLENETIVNLWYPFEVEPLTYLEMVGVTPLPEGRVTDFTRPACTFAFGRVPSHSLARFVDSLFRNVFACGEDYAVDVEVCRFPE